MSRQQESQAHTSSLLRTHARFADVYSLFESIVGQLPPALSEEFIRDVDQIRGKLDSWKALFTYEKEKVKFLSKKDRRKSFSDIHSLQEPSTLRSASGSCECSNESACATPTSSLLPPSPDLTTPPPPSTIPVVISTEQAQANEEVVSPVTDNLPLVLDNENDETWLCAVPQDSIQSVKEVESKPGKVEEPKPQLTKKSSGKKQISERLKSSTEWLRTKIPKVPGKSKSRTSNSKGTFSKSNSPPGRDLMSRSGRLSVELSTQSESRGRRFNSTDWRKRSTTV